MEDALALFDVHDGSVIEVPWCSVAQARWLVSFHSSDKVDSGLGRTIKVLQEQYYVLSGGKMMVHAPLILSHNPETPTTESSTTF